MKERPASAPAGIGDFDAHHAQLEQPIDEGSRHFGLIVHLPDERLDFPRGELEDALPEQGFVFLRPFSPPRWRSG